ncbi:ferrochelatase [Paenibacillus lentus]|uniref:Ferrochelatase n=1 Tax=Paenibacillus lentus TaxID=1338368 RepID=A0A3Q8S5U1_9BACL|nr:ferrochelatase [Paenibacillus lentus]AZK47876.1 ferrochelatase [Paenibacillus lentus]
MKAVLLMSYCHLPSIDDIPLFYHHLYHGRLPSPDIMERAVDRYRNLAKPDPLGSTTLRQARALERRLMQHLGEPIPVYTAHKHTRPFVHEAMEQIIASDVKHLYTLPLSPLYSKTGTGSYQRAAEQARDQQDADVSITHIPAWHLHDRFVEALSTRLIEALRWISARNRSRTVVIFTAHSKPGLPAPHRDYIAAFTELAEAVATQANCHNWKLAYRSGGPAPQKWLGPDVLEVMENTAQEGASAVIICDLLSMTENIETLQNCRLDGLVKARELGLEFATTEFLNDADDFMTALEEIVLAQILHEAPQ